MLEFIKSPNDVLAVKLTGTIPARISTRSSTGSRTCS